MINYLLLNIGALNLSHEYIALGLALLVGIILGVVGAGGSILTLPILVYVCDIEPKHATSYSLFLVGSTALFSAIGYFRKGLLDLKTAFFFIIPSFLSVFIMQKMILPMIPEQLFRFQNFTLTKDNFIMLFFILVMLMAAIKMITSKSTQEANELNTDENHEINLWAIAQQGFIVGSLTGLVGAGGGFLIVPSLTMYARLPIRLTIGTSLVIIAINSLSGFYINLSVNGSSFIDWTFCGLFIGMAIIGSLIGTYLGGIIKATYLKKIFGYFVILVASSMLLKILSSFGHP